MHLRRAGAQQAAIARGLAARDHARTSADYIPAETVLKELDGMLADARKRAAKRGK